jgi:hypothetical protein
VYICGVQCILTYAHIQKKLIKIFYISIILTSYDFIFVVRMLKSLLLVISKIQNYTINCVPHSRQYITETYCSNQSQTLYPVANMSHFSLPDSAAKFWSEAVYSVGHLLLDSTYMLDAFFCLFFFLFFSGAEIIYSCSSLHSTF